jgi:hypothetical protein
VNYEADQQWFAWHQHAMRRFLLNSTLPTSIISDAWLPAGTLSQVELKPSTECTQDLYWPHDPSLVTTSTPNFEGMNTLFEACSQTVALEGDHWDLSTVSTMRHQ